MTDRAPASEREAARDVREAAFDRVVDWVLRQQNTEWSEGFSEDFKRGYDAAMEEVDALVSARSALAAPQKRGA
jgi:hypothetical protein